ncbi:MAG: hypothetical protein ACE5E4_11505 [Candidatus Binatia bacterium]
MVVDKDPLHIAGGDTVLSEQFFALYGRGGDHDGERKLMLAVLHDAMDRYRRFALARDPRGRSEFIEAYQWVKSRDRNWLFSFENICELLSLDPDYIRKNLRASAPALAASKRRTPRLVPLRERERMDLVA